MRMDWMVRSWNGKQGCEFKEDISGEIVGGSTWLHVAKNNPGHVAKNQSLWVLCRREFVKNQEVHRDCSRKYETLSEKLKLTNCFLEKAKIWCGRTISEAGWKDANHANVKSCSLRPSSPKLGKCKCLGKPGPPSGDMYVTEMMNQFNGAQRHDPQMLLDHIKDNHPHLIRRVPPLAFINMGGNYRRSFEDDDEDVGCCPGKMGCGGGLRSKSGSQSPASSRGRGNTRGGVPGSRARSRSPSPRSRSPPSARGRKQPTKQKRVIFGGVSDLKHTAGGGVNLPPTQRYDFYRYFGYAGQGAKTSKGWHSHKVPWTQTPLDAQVKPRCHRFLSTR